MEVKALVSLSGGMDSATVLALAVRNLGKENVEAVGFRYGSKHNPHEIRCAKLLAEHYGVRYDVLDLGGFMSGFKSALLDPDWKIPEGHYEEESMKQTVVPARNLVFLSILSGLAVSRGMNQVWLGVHAGDHAVYPDCRPVFIDSARKAIRLATDTDLELVTPFLFLHKRDILRSGLTLGVPYGTTRTCYSDRKVACGKCGSCQERLSAFQDLGKEDPLEYSGGREIMPKEGEVG